LCIQAGADIVSIESVGGKEVHDDALMYARCLRRSPAVRFRWGASRRVARFSALWVTWRRRCATCGATSPCKMCACYPAALLEAFTELLAYDCRLMNVAAARDEALMLRDWLAESDLALSPLAAALTPAATLRIAEATVSVDSNYARAIAAGEAAIQHLRGCLSHGTLVLSAKELHWLDHIEKRSRGCSIPRRSCGARCCRATAACSIPQAKLRALQSSGGFRSTGVRIRRGHRP
jgi:hypothetical protein